MPSDFFSFRSITPGIEVLQHDLSLPRHRHLSAYATVVIPPSIPACITLMTSIKWPLWRKNLRRMPRYS
jgi:hypothetical protein